jgi:exo-beta-1,3-glucanase (GH17 family)
MQQSRILFALNLIIAIGIGTWLYCRNQPVTLVAPELPQQKLQCASYAPYYTPGQSPFIKGAVIPYWQIEHDLALLAERFDCVRTYSVSQGLDYVPEAAAKLGLEVILGVWIGWTDADNRRELELGIQRANQYPETVRALVVGNEVLLRQEQKPARLKAYIEHARNSARVPVTYADVWEFWLKNRDLEDSVDFITVHILPYWEDEPQHIDDAVPHAARVMSELQRTFVKPILIGETGWPSAGRQRNGAAPGQLNQARYIREFLQAAERLQWRYNLIEAFDQPWKRILEGTVGGHWGLYDSTLRPKFSLHAPVAERQDGSLPWVWALMGAVLFGLRAARAALATRQPIPPAVTAFLPLGGAAGMMAYLQADYLADACRDAIEWLALGGTALIGWAGLLALPAYVLGSNPGATRIIRGTLWLLSATMLVATILLLFDGRYRDFPLSLYLLPVLALGPILQLSGAALSCTPRGLMPMTVLAIISSLLLLWQEPRNLHLYYWIALLLMPAVPALSLKLKKTEKTA